jgi:hypothetical protein
MAHKARSRRTNGVEVAYYYEFSGRWRNLPKINIGPPVRRQ